MGIVSTPELHPDRTLSLAAVAARAVVGPKPDRFGAPSPEIGTVQFVGSNVDGEGFSIHPGLPNGIVRRLIVGSMLAFVTLAVAFLVLIAIGLEGIGPVAVAVALAVGVLVRSAVARPTRSREGQCVFVGSHGVTQAYSGSGRAEPQTIPFRDDVIITLDRTSVERKGSQLHLYTRETLEAWTLDGGSVGRVFSVYEREPDDVTRALHAAIDACGRVRLPSALARVARGESLVFPIMDTSSTTAQFSGHSLVLDAAALVYHAPGGQPFRVDRGSVQLAIAQGWIELRMTNGTVLGRFEQSKVGNWDLLVGLLPRAMP